MLMNDFTKRNGGSFLIDFMSKRGSRQTLQQMEDVITGNGNQCVSISTRTIKQKEELVSCYASW